MIATTFEKSTLGNFKSPVFILLKRGEHDQNVLRNPNMISLDHAIGYRVDF